MANVKQTSIKSFFQKAKPKEDQNSNNNFDPQYVVFDSDFQKEIKKEVLDNVDNGNLLPLDKIIKSEHCDNLIQIKTEKESDPESDSEYTKHKENNLNQENGLNEFSSESEFEEGNDTNLNSDSEAEYDPKSNSFSSESEDEAEEFDKEKKKNGFKCDTCGKIYSVRKTLKIHIRVVHEKSEQVKCDICHLVLSSKSTLKFHMKAKHEKSKSYKCKLCDKSRSGHRSFS